MVDANACHIEPTSVSGIEVEIVFRRITVKACMYFKSIMWQNRQTKENGKGSDTPFMCVNKNIVKDFVDTLLPSKMLW